MTEKKVLKASLMTEPISYYLTASDENKIIRGAMSLISRERVTSQHHYTRRKEEIEPRFINGVNLALVKSSLFHNFQSNRAFNLHS